MNSQIVIKNYIDNKHKKQLQDGDYFMTIRKYISELIGLLGDFSASINRGESDLPTIRHNLLLRANFLSKCNECELNQYLIILLSSSYYLCNLANQSINLIKKLNFELPDLDGDGLEHLLYWILNGDIDLCVDIKSELFKGSIDKIINCLINFFDGRSRTAELFYLAYKIRYKVYKLGTPRQLLLGDIISSVILRKINNMKDNN